MIYLFVCLFISVPPALTGAHEHPNAAPPAHRGEGGLLQEPSQRWGGTSTCGTGQALPCSGAEQQRGAVCRGGQQGQGGRAAGTGWEGSVAVSLSPGTAVCASPAAEQHFVL